MAISQSGAPLLRSPPCDVHFAGWKSTTHKLAEAGWQISMDQDVYHGGIRLAVRHPEIRCVGISATVEFDYLRRRQHQREEWPSFVINRFSASVEVRYEKGDAPFTKFQPVETIPHIMDHEVKNIEDLILFTPVRVAAQEIIVEEKDISDILADILQKQAPKQAEIRERVRKEQYRLQREASEIETIQPHFIHHANILTFAKRAA